MMRSRSGFTVCRLAVSWGRAGPGMTLVEPVTTWVGGILHRGYSVRLKPWRKTLHVSGYYLAGPALAFAWRA